MKTQLTILALVGLVMLGLGQLCVGTRSEAGRAVTAAPAAATSDTATASDVDAPAPLTGSVAPDARPTTPAPGEDRSRLLELPDGSFVQTLNGAVDAAPLATFWGPKPWSPIVGVQRSEAGVEWYEHANGSFSTTQMVWRPDLGRYDAMTRVAHVGPTPGAVVAR